MHAADRESGEERLAHGDGPLAFDAGDLLPARPLCVWSGNVPMPCDANEGAGVSTSGKRILLEMR